jgi:hypothetical protein
MRVNEKKSIKGMVWKMEFWEKKRGQVGCKKGALLGNPPPLFQKFLHLLRGSLLTLKSAGWA